MVARHVSTTVGGTTRPDINPTSQSRRHPLHQTAGPRSCALDPGAPGRSGRDESSDRPKRSRCASARDCGPVDRRPSDELSTLLSRKPFGPSREGSRRSSAPASGPLEWRAGCGPASRDAGRHRGQSRPRRRVRTRNSKQRGRPSLALAGTDALGRSTLERTRARAFGTLAVPGLGCRVGGAGSGPSLAHCDAGEFRIAWDHFKTSRDLRRARHWMGGSRSVVAGTTRSASGERGTRSLVQGIDRHSSHHRSEFKNRWRHTTLFATGPRACRHA